MSLISIFFLCLLWFGRQFVQVCSQLTPLIHRQKNGGKWYYRNFDLKMFDFCTQIYRFI
jgi:hypothetical protein